MPEVAQSIIAVSALSVSQWGCPYCGYRSGFTRMSTGGATLVTCGECDQGYIALADGVTSSEVSFGESSPQLQDHPREGIPSHGKPDKQPEGGGEFFWSRGIGTEAGQCFVCEIEDRDGAFNNIAAFVQCKASGDRLIAMFKRGAWVDFRKHSPDRVQVKIHACDEHLSRLQQLDELCSDGVITQERVDQVLG